MPDNRKNVQVAQPGIEGYDTADKNGWPTPLVSPLDPLKVTVTNGSNGEQKNIQAMSTDGQDKLSLSEGRAYVNTGNMESQGGHGNKFQTSQQNAGDIQQSAEEGD